MIQKHIVVCDNCAYKAEFPLTIRGLFDTLKTALRHAAAHQHHVRFYSSALEGMVEPSGYETAYIAEVKPYAV